MASPLADYTVTDSTVIVKVPAAVAGNPVQVEELARQIRELLWWRGLALELVIVPAVISGGE